MLEKRFIGIKECSEYLGVPKGTLYSWTFSRNIPYIKMGRLVKFDLKELEGWVKDRKLKPYE